MKPTPPTNSSAAVHGKLAALDWAAVHADLDAHGAAVIGPLLTPSQCDVLITTYSDDALFRKRVVMEHHGYGRGEYRYFTYPLPALVTELRDGLYPGLATLANRWNEAMSVDIRYPATHAEFKTRCHDAGQIKPTPLLLKYGPDDFNCLHQDIYGEHVFPLQVVFLLSQPGSDFTGGEFTLTEQRMRSQSRVEVVPLAQGQAVIFPVHRRPVKGVRKMTRAVMRHGVSRVRFGQRFTLGIIFHDAK